MTAHDFPAGAALGELGLKPSDMFVSDRLCVLLKHLQRVGIHSTMPHNIHCKKGGQNAGIDKKHVKGFIPHIELFRIVIIRHFPYRIAGKVRVHNLCVRIGMIVVVAEDGIQTERRGKNIHDAMLPLGVVDALDAVGVEIVAQEDTKIELESHQLQSGKDEVL
jgi:hypothetical protein